MEGTDMRRSNFFSINNSVIFTNDQHKVLSMNQAAHHFFGFEGNWEGKSIDEILSHPQLVERIKKMEHCIDLELKIFDRDCLINCTPINQDGVILGTITVIQDLSALKSYHTLQHQLNAIIESIDDGIYVVDGFGITKYVNAAYESITGLNRKDLIGRHMRVLMNEGFFDQSVSLLVLEQKKQISIMQKINGTKDVIVTGTPIFNDSGDINIIVTSVKDITQLNELRKKLNIAKNFSELQQNRYDFKINGSDQFLVFKSPQIQAIYNQVKQIAPFPTSILLTGPSGVGKEVFANLIHNESPRSHKPFIKVNCGAIPEQLLESELFGYERGAFTGANKEGKIGLLEMAEGGTVMFDEIGEMPLSLQVKLLRVLQEKQVTRIGGFKPQNLDIRILSATNKDLREEIRKGNFRNDLFYRLQVVELAIPSLSERKADIDVLIDHFFAHFSKEFHVNKKLSLEAKQLLIAYDWPGNIRELKNLIENMIVSVPSERIEAHHLPFHIYNQNKEKQILSLKQRVLQFEKQLIKEVLNRTPSLRKAAQELGVDHTTLVKKIKRW